MLTMLTRMGLLGSSVALASTLCLAFACTSKTGSDDDVGEGGDGNTGATSAKAGTGGASTGGSGNGGTNASGSGTGGSKGGMTSSTPNCEGAEVAKGTCQSIDDFEDGDDELLAVEGRGGKWYAFDDGTGTASPVRDAFETSAAADRPANAVHATGDGFTDYGGGVGFGLGACYDATEYTGLSFWAKADTAVLKTVRFSVATTDTRATDQGGTCEGTGCGDNYGIAIDLTDEWKQYEVKWSDMFQVGWGQKFAFNTHNLRGLDFTAYSDEKPFGWDFWIDDVAFTGGTDTECTPDGGGGGGAPSTAGGAPGAGGAD